MAGPSHSDAPERPPLAWRPLLALLKRLPQGALSRGLGRLADVPLPPAVRPLVLGAFARAVGVDVDEAERPLETYSSLGAFFVRRLRAGARQWPADPAVASSPVDGIVGEAGLIEAGRALQAKGLAYSTASLLGDPADAERYEGGSFLTIYLSPRHYHRIHAPVSGTIARARHLPGWLLPVNRPGVLHYPELFARNERLLCHIDAAPGPVALVAVGAYNVGRISAAFDADWGEPVGDARTVTNRRDATDPEARRYDPPVPTTRGDEVMAFHLGSTVVLLFAAGWALEPALPVGEEVRLGQIIARGTFPD